MASLKNILSVDPTLEAADRALEEKALSEPQRASRLGMSQIGDSCDRRVWYRYRMALREKFSARTLKMFHDGHSSEALQAERLRLVPGITLETIDPKTGGQFEYTDCDGHFVGKCDGKITGLLQAPTKLHVWEHKSNDKKFNEFKKIKLELGEKQTLRKWNYQYWCQAILYMFYEGTDRHYTTVSTPGGRDTESCRTESDTAEAIRLKAKANRVIKSYDPLERISDKPDFFECRYCSFKGICHEGEMPDRGCRTCAHATPIENSTWHCARWGKSLTKEEQVAGCPSHAFLPSLVPGEIIATTETSVTYKMKDGSIWKDGEVVNA